MLQELHAHGASCVTDGVLKSNLAKPPFKSLDEHYNPLGVYRKKFGAKTFFSVDRPGDDPDTSSAVWPPTGDRVFQLRGALPDALLKRPEAFVAAKVAAKADDRLMPLGDITNPPANLPARASKRNAPVVLPAWARAPPRHPRCGVAVAVQLGVSFVVRAARRRRPRADDRR